MRESIVLVQWYRFKWATAADVLLCRHNRTYCSNYIVCCTFYSHMYRFPHRVGTRGLLKSSSYWLAAADVGTLPLTAWRQQVGRYRSVTETPPNYDSWPPLTTEEWASRGRLDHLHAFLHTLSTSSKCSIEKLNKQEGKLQSKIGLAKHGL